MNTKNKINSFEIKRTDRGCETFIDGVKSGLEITKSSIDQYGCITLLHHKQPFEEDPNNKGYTTKEFTQYYISGRRP